MLFSTKHKKLKPRKARAIRICMNLSDMNYVQFPKQMCMKIGARINESEKATFVICICSVVFESHFALCKIRDSSAINKSSVMLVPT